MCLTLQDYLVSLIHDFSKKKVVGMYFSESETLVDALHNIGWHHLDSSYSYDDQLYEIASRYEPFKEMTVNEKYDMAKEILDQGWDFKMEKMLKHRVS